ncbi:prepilin peptidase [Aliiruegeria lutimaris]|uniref:Prepilin peptidase CpaA n=1 Tax=Aliiruegeria lutimaris TaxID=571298 RepID=A0A1G8XEA9_9RHOB|nr:prepilin peptidase [Aliiruegeria lutimaris]SDJ88949.1 prepilin peptidase CpaA [Aliiruegeria lutimaris]
MMLTIPASAATWFLPFAIPIGLWVGWNDMARMKIPNKAVMALFFVYLVIGPLALPLETYAWQWLHLVVVLVAGFVLNMIGLMGAGDAKFAAVMAPFVALGDAATFCYIYVACSLAALVVHRTMRAIPAIRRAAPGWESWERKDFPMGLALGWMLILYLALGVAYGR